MDLKTLATFHHRSRLPWVAQTKDGGISIMARTYKESVKSINLVACDSMVIPRLKKDYHEVKMKCVAKTNLYDIWNIEIKNKSKRYRYGFVLSTKEEKHYIGEKGLLPSKREIFIQGHGFTYAYWNKQNLLNAPEWFRSTNWYQIFPDRFAKTSISKNNRKWDSLPLSHEKYGGDIKGIINRLRYIKKLGFTGIYLTPVFESPSSHRYDTTDYYKIDPDLGNEDDMKTLIEEAHKLGIKVMLDAVLNHIGASSRQWQDVLKKGKKSKYADWFWINDWSYLKQPKEYQGDFYQRYPYETFARAPQMPRLNWNNPEVSEFLINAALKWTKMGIDGWRLDVSFEPPVNFWKEFNKAVRAVKKDIAIIGEVWWDSIEWLRNDVWDSVMNYPMRETIIDFFNGPMSEKTAIKFVHDFNSINSSYSAEQNSAMFNLLSSHDTPRLITLLNNDLEKYKMAMRVLYFLPGCVSVYYGEEMALQGEQDPDNRRTMPQSIPQHELQDFFKEQNMQKAKKKSTTEIFEYSWAKIEKNKIVINKGKETMEIGIRERPNE